MAVMYVRLRHKSASSEDTIALVYNDIVTETDKSTSSPTSTDTNSIIDTDLEYWRNSQREKQAAIDRQREIARQTDGYSMFDLDRPIVADRN